MPQLRQYPTVRRYALMARYARRCWYAAWAVSVAYQQQKLAAHTPTGASMQPCNQRWVLVPC